MTVLLSRFLAPARFGAGEHVAAKLLDLATLAIVLRSLPSDEVALFGIASGILVVFSLVGVVPDTILVRSFRAWERDGTAQRAVEAFQWFWIVRASLLVGGGLGVAALLGGNGGRTLAYAAALAAANQLGQLAELSRVVHRLRLQQKLVVEVELWLRALLCLSSLGILYVPRLWTYLAIYVTWSALAAAVWSVLLHRATGARGRWSRGHPGFIWRALTSFSFWQHLNGIATLTLYTIDPWMLAMFGVATTAVGHYTLALKVSSLFFVVPMFVQQMTGIVLTNLEDRAQWGPVLSRILGLNCLVAFGQWVAYLVLGPSLLRLFGGGDTPLIAFQLGILINTGVFLLNLTRPIISYLMLRADMRRLCVSVYLPSLGGGLALYVGLTAAFGLWGAATASFLSYALFGGLLLLHASRAEHRPPAPSLDWRLFQGLLALRSASGG